MTKRTSRTPIATVTERLRKIVLENGEGDFIGNEEALIAKLGCSRSTIRQVARLLEREGLLTVRPGINGGYFGARPGSGTIQTMVATYLEVLDIDRDDVTIIASALWVEAMRKASVRDPEQIESAVKRLRKNLKKIGDTATFDEIRDNELKFQSEIFQLAESSYIKLIFDINAAYSLRTYSTTANDDESEYHSAFVRSWRDAKALEINALSARDSELAALAAQHSRKIWHERIRKRYP